MTTCLFACNSFVIPSWGTRKRLHGLCAVYGLCCGRAVSAAVRPLCAVRLTGSCQAVTLGPDSDGSPLMSGSAVRLSDTCCQTVRESAVSAVRLSGTVRRCPGFAVRLSDQGSGAPPNEEAPDAPSAHAALRSAAHGPRHAKPTLSLPESCLRKAWQARTRLLRGHALRRASEQQRVEADRHSASAFLGACFPRILFFMIVL